MRDILFFRRMLTPCIVQVLFWVGVIICIVGAINNFIHHAFLHGLQILVLGPLILRVVSEFIIVFFRINETLTALKNSVQEKP